MDRECAYAAECSFRTLAREDYKGVYPLGMSLSTIELFDLRSLLPLCFYVLFVLRSFILFLRLCRCSFIIYSLHNFTSTGLDHFYQLYNLSFNFLNQVHYRKYAVSNPARSPRLGRRHRSQISAARTPFQHVQACR